MRTAVQAQVRPKSPGKVSERERAAAPIITPDRRRAISREVSSLRQQLEVEFAERLRQAREFGEIESNDDYLQIREEEAVVASHLERLQMILRTAVVHDQASPSGSAVALGSTVEVTDLATGQRQAHRVTGGYEPLRPGEISINSPLGRALLGREQGDQVRVTLPVGRMRGLKITAVHSDLSR